MPRQRGEAVAFISSRPMLTCSQPTARTSSSSSFAAATSVVIRRGDESRDRCYDTTCRVRAVGCSGIDRCDNPWKPKRWFHHPSKRRRSTGRVSPVGKTGHWLLIKQREKKMCTADRKKILFGEHDDAKEAKWDGIRKSEAKLSEANPSEAERRADGWERGREKERGRERERKRERFRQVVEQNPKIGFLWMCPLEKRRKLVVRWKCSHFVVIMGFLVEVRTIRHETHNRWMKAFISVEIYQLLYKGLAH